MRNTAQVWFRSLDSEPGFTSLPCSLLLNWTSTTPLKKPWSLSNVGLNPRWTSVMAKREQPGNDSGFGNALFTTVVRNGVKFLRES